MVFDPKFVVSDIIASVDAVPCDYDELLRRFDNNTNYLLQLSLQKELDHLVKAGFIRKTKKGIIKSTASGRKYIRARGYYD